MVTGHSYSVQTIGVPLQVGSRVTLLEDVDVDDEGGSAASIMFEDHVDQYVPETGLLVFEESDIGRAEFHDLLDGADGVEIIRNP